MTEIKNDQFNNKWKQAGEKKTGEEFSIFVSLGKEPVTQRQLFLYNYHKLFRGFIDGRKVNKTLEMGCGRGTLSMYLNIYDGLDVSLCDISEDGADLARKNFALHGAKGNIFVADARSINIPDSQFDLVFSIGLLEHLTDYEKVIAEKYRLTRQGGLVISLNIPEKFSIQFINSIYRSILRMFGASLKLKKDYYRNADSPETYKQAFRKAGFKNPVVLHVAPFPIITPVPAWSEKLLAYVYRAIIWLRSLYKKEPFGATALLGQAHFIIAEKT